MTFFLMNIIRVMLKNILDLPSFIMELGIGSDFLLQNKALTVVRALTRDWHSSG